jgi:hypothetical protein
MPKKYPKSKPIISKSYDITNFSTEQLSILDNIYYAIRLSDPDKVKSAVEMYSEAYLEEQVTIGGPDIRVQVDGLGNILYINKVNCLPDNFEP